MSKAVIPGTSCTSSTSAYSGSGLLLVVLYFQLFFLFVQQLQDQGSNVLDGEVSTGGLFPVTEHWNEWRHFLDHGYSLLNIHALSVPYQLKLCTTNLRKFTNRW